MRVGKDNTLMHKYGFQTFFNSLLRMETQRFQKDLRKTLLPCKGEITTSVTEPI